MRIFRLTAALVLATLAFSGTAQATLRFATPGGKGTTCEKAVPCSVIEAYEKAQSGDEVIVAGGTYNLQAEQLAVAGEKPGVTIRGNPSEPPPLIVGAPPASLLVSTQGTVEYLDIESRGEYAGILCIGCQVDRVEVMISRDEAWGIESYGGGAAVRDSVLLANGHESTGFFSLSPENGELADTLTNVTAVATGAGSVGVKSQFGGVPPGKHLVEVRNTIASGEEADLLATEVATGDVGEISVKNSNFDNLQAKSPTAIKDQGGNQSAQPVFVNAAANDYREAAGSPTIDAGVVGGLGALDLDGNSRALGGAVDIGAYEYVPPPPPGAIQSLSLKPHAFRANKGATISYVLSAAGSVDFTIERKLAGRKAGKKCVKKTRGNSDRHKCALLKPVKGTLAGSGAAGSNSFKFSGRLGGRALKPGSYLLIGSAGGATKRTPFRILG